MGEASKFLSALFKHNALNDLYAYLWLMSPGGRGGITQPFRIGGAKYATMEKAITGKPNMYFGLSMTDFPLAQDARPHKDNVKAISALWLDIDFAHPSIRKKDCLPERWEDIEPALDGMPECSIVVNSGYGQHLYWLLTDPVIADSQATAIFLDDLVYNWNAMFRSRFEKLGFNLDATSTCQLLRIPGSMNAKLDPHLPVSIMNWKPEVRHRPGDLHSVISQWMNAQRDGVGCEPADAVEARVRHRGAPSDVPDFDFAIKADAELKPEDLEMYLASSETFKAIWDGEKRHASASEHDLALASFLRAFGCGAQETCDGIIHSRRLLGFEPKLRMDYIASTIHKADQSYIVRQSKIDAAAEEGVTSVEPERESMRKQMESFIGLRIERAIKYMSDPPTYIIEVVFKGKIIKLTFPTIKDLRSQSNFMDRLMEQTNKYHKQLTKPKWNRFLELLLPFVTEESSGDTGTMLGVFRSRVGKYINTVKPIVLDEDEYQLLGVHSSNGEPYREGADDTLVVFVDAQHFQNWHNMDGMWERVRLVDVNRMFRDCAAKAVHVGIKATKAETRPTRWRLKVSQTKDGRYIL